MSINVQESSSLEKQWNESNQRIIVGKNHTYKIYKEQFLGRGGFGIVFGGLCRMAQKIIIEGNEETIKYSFKEVAIKQFKKSQKWKREQDLDKELLLLSKYGKILDPNYVLQAIDIFLQKESHRYFLITPLAKGGNLYEKIFSIKDQEQIYKFCIRLASILKYIHFDALASYKSKERSQSKESMAIIHRDVKPQNIVFKKGDDIDTLYLLDFGIAKVGYTEFQKGYNNCGTSYYKACQIGQGRIYNAKVDVYGFACTLYEILNDGQRMMTNYGLGTRYGDRQRFIKTRLVDLQLKLRKANKIKHHNYWIDLLHNCFLYDIKKRFSSEKLLTHLKGNSVLLVAEENKLYYGELSERQQIHKEKKQNFQLNFEIFRLSIIQNIIFTIFEFIYFEQPRINKFLLYTLIKFIALTFAEKFNKAKQRCRLLQKTQKGIQLRNTIEQKRINDLREKSHSKIKKEIMKQETNNQIQHKQGFGPVCDMIKRYPQILHEKIIDPKRILSEFCYQKKNEILQNQKFARYIATILCYLQDMDYYDQLKLQSADLDNTEIELLSIRKLNYFSKYIEDKITREYLKTKLQNCRVEGTLRSNINKEENKTDIEIQMKTND